MAHDDFAQEPVRGLPETPPEGERILWQGAPRWTRLARHAYGARAVMLYFVALAALRGGSLALDGAPAVEVLAAASWLVLAGAVAAGILALMGWGAARNTVYTITNRRVAMRIGWALTVTLNLPFTRIAAADLKLHADGTGTIPLTLSGETRLAYLMLWPHVRPWKIGSPQPALRCIPDAERVAGLLARELSRVAAEPGPAAAPAPAPAAQPARHPAPIAAE
jgi:hypothetical protein